MKKIITTLLILFLSFHCSFSQFESVRDIVIRQENTIYNEPAVIPLKSKGLLVVIQNSLLSNIYTLICYDSLLNTLWTEKYTTTRLPSFVKAYYDKNDNYYIISQKESKFSLLKINLTTKKSKTTSFKTPFPIKLVDFKVLKDDIFLTGYFKNKALALKYSYGEGEAKVLPSFFNKEIEIKGIFDDLESNSIYFVIKNIKNCELSIRPYSANIGISDLWQFPKKNNLNIRDMAFAGISNSEKLIVGTQNNNCTDIIQGLLSINVNPKNQLDSKSYKFVDFANYLNQYRDKRRQRVLDRIAKRKSENKETILTSRLSLNPELKNNKKTWVAIGENYTKEYKQIQGGPGVGMRSEQIFDGYLYRYALFCGFDKTGKKLWDNLMKIDGLKKYDLNPLIQVGFQGDSIIAAYKDEDALYVKMFYQSKTIRKEYKQKIDGLMSDRINLDNDAGFVHWYGNSFLLFGTKPYVDRASSLDYYIQHIIYTPKEEISPDAKEK